MTNGIRTGDPRWFNKGRSPKLHVGSWFRQTPEESRMTYRPKRCRNNNKDDDNCAKILIDKNQVSSQNFRQYFTLFGLVVRVFANGPGDLGSIPGRVIPKIQKLVLDAYLLNTQHYKVRIKGKVEQTRERSSALPYTLV